MALCHLEPHGIAADGRARAQYLMGNQREHASLQPSQVDGEALSQLVEEHQVEGYPTQGVENTEHLAGHSARGQITIAWETGGARALALAY